MGRFLSLQCRRSRGRSHKRPPQAKCGATVEQERARSQRAVANLVQRIQALRAEEQSAFDECACHCSLRPLSHRLLDSFALCTLAS
eukprot:SAG11_NODE_4459_length_1888_cov_1.320291_5_plen_86_part_00